MAGWGQAGTGVRGGYKLCSEVEVQALALLWTGSGPAWACSPPEMGQQKSHLGDFVVGVSRIVLGLGTALGEALVNVNCSYFVCTSAF